MEPLRGHEDSKAFDQLERREELVGGAITPAVSEAVDEMSVRSPGQAVGRERRSRGVANQPLEPRTVVGGNGDGCMQGDAAAADAAGSLRSLHGSGLDPIAEPALLLARPR